MGSAAGEIPEIVLFHIRDKTLAVVIDRGDPRRSVKHDGPLARGVPMQFPNAARCQPHVYARDGF